MKKLLALVLCVMMFVSVLSTSAFAAIGTDEVDSPLLSSDAYAKQIKDMIKNSRKDIEKAYKVLAGDQVTYNTLKSMDDIIVDLVDAIGNTLIAENITDKAGIDGVKDNVRAYMDTAVAKKIAKNYHKAYDSDGKVDPLLYAQLIADSVQSALTDKNFQKGYEAVVTYWALVKLAKDVNKELEDQYDDFYNGIDGTFQSKFAARYATLAANYVDTLASAAAKRVANENVLFDYNWGEGGVQEGKFDYEQAVLEAEGEYDTAVAGAAADKADAYATAKEEWEESEKTAADELAYRRAIAEADAEYKIAVAAAAGEYNTAVADAQDTYDGILEAAAPILDGLQTINPWGAETYAQWPRF